MIRVIYFLMLLSLAAHATILKQAGIDGKVSDIGRDYVSVDTEGGTVKIPRAAFGKQELRPGQSVHVIVDIDQILDLNAKQRAPAARVERPVDFGGH